MEAMLLVGDLASAGRLGRGVDGTGGGTSASAHGGER